MQGIAKQAIQKAYGKGIKTTSTRVGVQSSAVVGLNYSSTPDDHLNNILGGTTSTVLGALPGIGPFITIMMIGGTVIDSINPNIVELSNEQLAKEKKAYLDVLSSIVSKMGEQRSKSLRMFAVPLQLENEEDLKQYGKHLRDYIAQNKLLLNEDAIIASDTLSSQLNTDRLARFRRFLDVAKITSKEYVDRVNLLLYEETKKVQTRRAIKRWSGPIIILLSFLCLFSLSIVSFSSKS